MVAARTPAAYAAETRARAVERALVETAAGQLRVSGIERKQRRRNPAAPFTTSTLQQEASRKLGFNTQRTMRVAQKLYEGIELPGEGQVGLITYMRTDSVMLSEKALAEANARGAEAREALTQAQTALDEGEAAVRRWSDAVRLQAIREAVGGDYPILIKLNCKEFVDQGLQPKEFVQVGKMLADAGIDAIEISGGLPVSPKTRPSQLGINKEEKEAYFQEEARALRKETDVTLILVGGNRSFHVAEGLVAEGVADYISMSRPLIREPHLINRWKAGDQTKAACISDNMCFRPAIKGDGIYCVTERREQAKEK